MIRCIFSTTWPFWIWSTVDLLRIPFRAILALIVFVSTLFGLIYPSLVCCASVSQLNVSKDRWKCSSHGWECIDSHSKKEINCSWSITSTHSPIPTNTQNKVLQFPRNPHHPPLSFHSFLLSQQTLQYSNCCYTMILTTTTTTSLLPFSSHA